MSQLKYSFGGDRISILFSDGRISVRERANKDDVLLVPPCGATCLDMNENGSLLAIGTESGHIIVHDVKTQKQQILANRVEKVTAVKFLSGRLFSAQSGKVSKWTKDLSEVELEVKCESKKEEVSQLGEMGGHLVAASKKIRIFEGKAQKYEWIGHSDQILALNTSEDGKYLVSYGQTSTVAVWTENNEKTECRFQITGRARSIETNENRVLILNDISGNGNQIEVFDIYASKKPIKCKRSLNITDDNGDQVEILGARFAKCAKKSEKIEIVYGASGAISWETVDLKGHDNLERNVFKKGGRKSRENGEINGKPAQRLTGENAIKKKRRTESLNEADMSMAERLGLTNGVAEAPKAGSVTMVLQQALHSRDKKQISAVLLNKDMKLIRDTVKQVPAQMAPVLVEEISSRLQTDPERALSTARWLRTTIQYHSGPLAAISRDVLESTRIPLETRTTALSHLKRLQGKLELAISAGNVSEDDEEDVGVTENDVTDIDSASHSESDWEPEFNPNEETALASESGAESEADLKSEAKRRKIE